MNRICPLKVFATMAVVLAIGVIAMACSPQTAGKSSSSSSGSYSSGSEASSARDSQSSATGSVNATTSSSAQASPGDGASKSMACIGDSITYGHGLDNPDEQSWPALMQVKLGDDWRVTNLGVSGTTLIDEGRFPYHSTGNVEKAKELGSDLYVIMLGTNDASDQAFTIESYRSQLAALVDELASATSRDGQAAETDASPQPQFVLMAPPRTFYYLKNDRGAEELNRVIGVDIRGAVQSVAADKGARYIDLYALTEQHPEWFPDYLHPNAEGAAAIADYIYDQLFNHS